MCTRLSWPRPQPLLPSAVLPRLQTRVCHAQAVTPGHTQWRPYVGTGRSHQPLLTSGHPYTGQTLSGERREEKGDCRGFSLRGESLLPQEEESGPGAWETDSSSIRSGDHGALSLDSHTCPLGLPPAAWWHSPRVRLLGALTLVPAHPPARPPGEKALCSPSSMVSH